MALDLYPHNQKAYQSALAMLNEAGRAAVIHPTGTGKSFIAFKLAEDHPQAKVCWLSPSRYIASQQCENRRKCDPDGTTDNITFLTYARLMANRDRVSQIEADYIILDEFHRCGAAEWSKGVKALLAAHPQAKVLGLSATRLRYLDEQRDMAEELFAGNIASQMTLGEAIAAGILASPRYVISVYRWEEEWEKYREKVRTIKEGHRRQEAEKQLFWLRRSLERAGGIEAILKKYLQPDGKYIVFCSGAAHMEEMKARAPEWFAGVNPGCRIYAVCSENPESENEFCRFKTDTEKGLKLLFCINMLNEGIHLEDVDGVLLLRPTVSPVIYRQQIGRALTAGKREAGGKTEPPLILDMVNNFENLHSIHSMEPELEAAFTEDTGAGKPPVLGRMCQNAFQIVDETCNAGTLFAELQKKLSAGWEDYYQEAAAYYEKRGDLDIPGRYVSPSGLALGSWLQAQRRIYMGKIPGQLSEEQIKKLEKLGVCWESCSDRQWDRYYAQARQYYAKTGNLDVKISYRTEDGFRLGVWLNNLRQYRLSGSRALGRQRQRQLERIGMIWDKLAYKWEQGYEASRAYFFQHGNLHVPAGFITKEGFRLGNWIAAQRQNRKGKNQGALPLTQEQIARLDAIGMEWGGSREEQWERGFAAASAYYEKTGNLEIPYGYETEEGFRLGRWLFNQKRSLGRSLPDGEAVDPLSEKEKQHRARLSALGVVWEKDSWWEKWERARQYYETQGNLNLPQSYVTEDGVWLGKWLYLQRERRRHEKEKDRLSEKQIRALESIGMDWLPPSERAWENAFEKAKRYYEENGHLNVEKGDTTEEGFRLDLWVSRQRKCRREGKDKVLSRERIRRLEEIGIRW